MKALLITAVLILIPLAADCAIPAFPGAEGFGAYTPGGRGGRVIEVTNLNDSGPGSLRAACEAKGPRIVVFRVGGTIRVKSHLEIEHPNITIAGQTAPGDGILIRDAGLSIQASDVVVRYIRVRIGVSKAESANSQDCLHIGGDDSNPSRNIIADHCSFSWGMDENADAYSGASDFTIQWCIMSEGLRNSGHEKGAHSMGLLVGDETTSTSIHHNLFAHNDARNPRIKGGFRDIVNNVIYDWGGTPGMFTGTPRVNFVGNFYKPGPDSDTGEKMIVGDDLGVIFIRDNVYPGKGKSEWDLVAPGKGGIQSPVRFDAPRVTIHRSSLLYVKVLKSVGCSFPKRDAVDERIIADVRNGTGKIIDNPDQVGGFPVISGGEAPSDQDHDGMPDAWEKDHGLDPEDPSDASKDRDRDGYTNIEEYINGLVT